MHVGFPLHFWEGFVDTIVYLINKGILSTLYGGIPEEALIGKNVKYSFLRTFGCESFFHIDKDDRKSLRLNPRNVPLLDMGLMILVIVCGIMKNEKSLGVEM